MAFCISCGERLSEAQATCPRCGMASESAGSAGSPADLPAQAADRSSGSPLPPPPLPGFAPFPVGPGAPADQVPPSGYAAPGYPGPGMGQPGPPGPYPAPGAPTGQLAVLGFAPAGLGERILATIIDAAVITVALLPLYGLIATVGSDRFGRSNAFGFLLSLLSWALMVGYGPFFIGAKGATIGKNVMKLKVVDAATGGPIGFGRAIGRFLVLWVMALPCYLGYLSILLDKSGWYRGWHDQAVTSTVVRTTAVVPLGEFLRFQR